MFQELRDILQRRSENFLKSFYRRTFDGHLNSVKKGLGKDFLNVSVPFCSNSNRNLER